MARELRHGDDCLTTFLAGVIGLLIFGSLAIWLLSIVFGD